MSLDLYLNMNVDTGGAEPYEVELWWSNITHNVIPMWRLAGVLDALYESHDKQAGELLDVLDKGVAHMGDNPALYEPLNPENGWGNYAGAYRFLCEFRDACRAHPNATIYVSR